MTPVPLPENYHSIEHLSNWLKQHIPHEFDVDGGVRWIIVTGWDNWHITFVRNQDATYFNLKWPR